MLKKRHFRLILLISLLIAFSATTSFAFKSGGFLEKASKGPTSWILMFISTFFNVLSLAFHTLLDTYDLSIDKMVYAQCKFLQVDLVESNLFGKVILKVYETLKSTTLMLMYIPLIDIARKTWGGTKDATSVARAKENLKNYAIAMLLIFNMTMFINAMISARNKVLNAMYSGSGILGGLVNSLGDKAFETYDVLDAIMYAASIGLSLFYAVIYVILTLNFVYIVIFAPVACMFLTSEKLKEKFDKWASGIYAYIFTPLMDGLLLLVVTSIVNDVSVPGPLAVLFLVCVIPVRIYLKNILGLGSGIIPELAAIGAMKAAFGAVTNASSSGAEMFSQMGEYKRTKKQYDELNKYEEGLFSSEAPTSVNKSNLSSVDDVMSRSSSSSNNLLTGPSQGTSESFVDGNSTAFSSGGVDANTNQILESIKPNSSKNLELRRFQREQQLGSMEKQIKRNIFKKTAQGVMGTYTSAIAMGVPNVGGYEAGKEVANMATEAIDFDGFARNKQNPEKISEEQEIGQNSNFDEFNKESTDLSVYQGNNNNNVDTYGADYKTEADWVLRESVNNSDSTRMSGESIKASMSYADSVLPKGRQKIHQVRNTRELYVNKRVKDLGYESYNDVPEKVKVHINAESDTFVRSNFSDKEVNMEKEYEFHEQFASNVHMANDIRNQAHSSTDNEVVRHNIDNRMNEVISNLKAKYSAGARENNYTYNEHKANSFIDETNKKVSRG